MGHGFCGLRVCDHPACGHVRVSDELARHGTTGGVERSARLDARGDAEAERRLKR